MLALLLLACEASPPPVPTVRLGDVREAEAVEAVSGVWGEDFGRDPDAPLGPLAVLADGEGFAVLDQERQRVLRYDRGGALRGEVPIPERTTLDAVAAGTGFGLLTYHRLPSPGWQTQRVDAGGALLEQVDLPPEWDAPSGVFLHEGALLVEQAHGELIDPRTGARYPGRPDGAGRFVSAVKEGELAVAITWQGADGADLQQVRLEPDRPVASVMALDPRPDGVLVGMLLFQEGPAPDFEMLRPELRVVLVEPGGLARDEISLPLAAETTVTRYLARSAAGDLYQLRTGDRALSVARVELR